jgi:hypothetical protein
MPQNGDPVRAGHGQICQHDVEIELIDKGDGGLAIGRLVDFIPFPSQQLGQTLSGRLLIFDN